MGWWTKSLAQCSLDNEMFHSGGTSLKLAVADKGKRVLVGQKVPVRPGESYDIGAWIKTENVSAPGAQICIEWSGRKGWLGGDWSAKKVEGTKGWRFSGISGVRIPEEATSATVYLYLNKGSTGTAWFDDVVVRSLERPLMKTFFLRPNYRGKIMPGAPSPEVGVEIILNPGEHGLELDQLEVKADLKNKTGVSIAGESHKRFPSKRLEIDLDVPDTTPPEHYNLSLGLYRSGKVLSENTYVLERLSQEDLSSLTSYVDRTNRFILNREPFFPIGLYVVQHLSNTSQLDEIANSPFDTLMNYNVNSGTDAQITNYLNQLQSRNLKLIFSLVKHEGLLDIHACTQKVMTFRDHPAVISWYMNDERGLEYLPELAARYQKVRELDKNHPVWSVNMRKYVLMGEGHTTDILGVDPYPIPNNPITLVSQMADWAKEAGRGCRPFWLVPQIFDWSECGGKGRPPTWEEMRAMTYLAVNHGAKGLIYYSYFNIRDDNDYRTRWEQIKDIASEIKLLRSVLLSTDEIDDGYMRCDSKDIDLKLMKHGTSYYAFAINTKKDIAERVSFRVEVPNRAFSVDLLFEDGRSIETANGIFADDFGPYEVHVYHWTDRAAKDQKCLNRPLAALIRGAENAEGD